MDDVRLRDVDRGWAWVALVVSAVNLMIVEWFFISIGIFQVEFLDHFSGSTGYIALVGSLAVACPLLLGPVGGLLSKLLTPRVTIMLGAAVMSVGQVASSFAQDSVSLLVLFGLMAGGGMGICYGPSVVVVSGYFRKHRVMATGISLSAPGVGVLTAPYLLRWLIKDYGWRFAVVVLGFLTAQAVVLAALLFPPNASSQASSRPPGRQPAHDDPPLITVNSAKPAEEDRMDASRPLHPLEQKDVSRLKNTQVTQVTQVKDVAGSRTTLELTVSEFGSMLLSSSMMLPVGQDTPVSFRDKVRHVLGRKLMWVVFMNQLLMNVGYSINLVLLPAYARDQGVTLQQLPALFTVAGVTTLVTRLAGGLVFSRLPARHLLKPFFCMHAVFALTLSLLPFYGTSLVWLCVHSFFVALTYGVIFLLLSPILVHYLGLDDLPLNFGALLFFSGITYVVSPPLGGFLHDISGSYNLAFHLAGGMVGVSTLSLLLLLLIKDLEPHEHSDAKEDKLIPSTNQSHADGGLLDDEYQTANEKLRSNDETKGVSSNCLERANEKLRFNNEKNDDGDFSEQADEKLLNNDESNGDRDNIFQQVNEKLGSTVEQKC